ncbi:MAG: helix-turn-helix domain-containing protein [Algoriphagus sp.]|nr:helix-turn-helix domain-containing protein [Algoriphagus sp.]
MQLVQSEHIEDLVKDVRELTLILKKSRSTSEFPELLRTDEVKKILKVKDSTLATLRQNGTLPFTKIGGTIYYLKKDIIKLLKDNYSGTDEI